MRAPSASIAIALAAFAASLFAAAPAAQRANAARIADHAAELFATSDQCLACHNGMRTPSGEDVSIGSSWRTSMMANAARDPYWHAAVRREVMDHPRASAEIQDECSKCHMPMARTAAHLSGGEGEVFAHLPISGAAGRLDRLAHDGVACSLCHQITDQGLGTPASFTGGYTVTDPGTVSPRPMFGPFETGRGLTAIMRSATGFQPTEALHVRQSELCATCHTLITKALGPNGDVIGELPEQVPFQEWQHSAYAGEQRSCQSCHMPLVQEETPIASVLGAPRKGFARHTFVGGNFFMQRMLSRYRDELGVPAPVADMDAAVRATIDNLQTAAAKVSVDRAGVSNGRLIAEIRVENLTGHKLPTGYPSRRAWLHLTVRDRSGRVVFESGAIEPRGSIAGNDNDANATEFEPHYAEIRERDQVQIYESVMRDSSGGPTTGLLSAVGYLKDNRLLPRGFEKSTADAAIAVVGAAAADPDFTGASDRVRYDVEVGGGAGPFDIDVELRFQVISFRWAENLRAYNSSETNRFVGYYESMSSASSEVIASTRATAR